MNFLTKSALQGETVPLSIVLMIMLGLFMQGCDMYQYKPERVDTDSISSEINSWRLHSSDLTVFLQANGITQDALDSQDFSVKRLYLTGLYYNPEMKTAYRQWHKAQIVAEHSAYKINPELGIPFEHHSDTSAGQSAWTIGAVLNFIYERKGKREARRAEAALQLINARLAIERLAIESYTRLERHYYNYITSRSRMAETESEITILRDLLGQLQNRYESGAVSQFEISSTTLELQKRLFELNLQKNLVQAYKDSLLAMTYLPPAEFENINISYSDPLAYARELYRHANLQDAEFPPLQAKMLGNHIDMALKLNSYAQSEARLRLEIEKQYPDIVLSPGFIFDQSDNIWSLGASWVLPLFRNSRQNLQIRKALEDRKIGQQEIIALQQSLLNALYQKYRSVLRQYRTLDVSDEIITAIDQRAEIIKEQMQLGGTDSIALLRNRVEFYQAKETQAAIYHDAINAMLEFEQLMQGVHYKIDIQETVAQWIELMGRKDSHEQDY